MININLKKWFILVFLLVLICGNKVFAIDPCTNNQTVRDSVSIKLLARTVFNMMNYMNNASCGYLDTPYDVFGLQAHPGIDLPMPLGTPVYSVTDGHVIYTDKDNGHVAIRLSNGNIVNYYHMDTVVVGLNKVVTNSPIKKGAQIGTVGSKGGASTGYHLHIEVRVGYTGHLPIGGVYCNGYCTIDDLKAKTQNPVLLVTPLTVNITEVTSGSDGLVTAKFKVTDPAGSAVGWDAYLLGGDRAALSGSAANKRYAVNAADGVSGVIHTVTWTATEAAQAGLEKGKNYTVGVDGFGTNGSFSSRTYSNPFTWKNSLAVPSIPIVTVGADKSITATYSVTDPDGGTLSADAYLLKGDGNPLPNDASRLTKKTTPDGSPSGTTFTATWTAEDLAQAGLQKGLYYTVGVNGYDISGMASDRAYSRAFIWNDSTNPLNSTCNEPAMPILSIVPNVYSFNKPNPNNRYQAFEVVCTSGRTGGVRLPMPNSNLIQVYPMRICAYRETNCNIPASNCRGVNTMDDLATVYSKRNLENINQNDPIIGPLANWVCGNEN